ncbi:hypothetical protein PsWM33_02184 [Pseudovibrio sp. WM33]|nr:hypothetical protein PsWM33_02184 [Pseudovibrio sp. WM33]
MVCWTNHLFCEHRKSSAIYKDRAFFVRCGHLIVLIDSFINSEAKINVPA